MKGESNKILIVDDDLDSLRLVGMRLRANGYEIITATDGEKAIETTRQEYPDLLLLDLELPKTNGFEVCRILKSDPRTRRIPIIILSAKSQEADRVQALNLGADAYLVKPFAPRVLLGKVKSYLESLSSIPRGHKQNQT